MPDENQINLSRRKVLGSLGAVGVASAGAGLGTTAYFSDEESFDNNTLTAGELDLKVDWEEHYWDDFEVGVEVEHVESRNDVGSGQVGLPDPENPIVAVDESDLEAFMDATTTESGGPTDNPDPGVIELRDVKPGDFGEVTFSYHLYDNPGWVRMSAEVHADDENGQTEPEMVVDDTTGAGNGELGEVVQAALWYDPDCDNVFDEEESLIKRGTLAEVMDFLGASDSDPPLLDPTKSGGRIADEYSGYCHAPTTGFGGPPFECSEKLYMTNTVDDPEEDPPGTEPFGSPADDTTKLYEVDIAGGDANLTEIFDFTGMDKFGDSDPDYNHIVAIAASPDGQKVYVVDKFSKGLGEYDVANDEFSHIGQIGGVPSGTLQAAVSPDGTLYVTVWGEENLWTIDTSDASVTETISISDSNGDPIEVGGSDIAFTSDGTLYLIDANTPDNTDDLYELSDPTSGNAVKIADFGSDVNLPGLAVRAAGDGNLVGSNNETNALTELDPSDGSVVDTYDMVEPGGAGTDFDHVFGDMTVGSLCPEHCIGLAWWVPRSAGNDIQSDEFTFDITFRTEQCRHNDDDGQADS